MKFGATLLILLIVGAAFISGGCTVRSPAVELFSKFKAHIVAGEIDTAHQMLATNGRPSLEAFRKGFADQDGNWRKWFTGSATLQEVRRVDAQENMITGDLVSGQERQIGAFEIVRLNDKAEWQILWKLGASATDFAGSGAIGPSLTSQK